MKKKLNKSLLRFKKKNPELNELNNKIKNLSPYEISIFRALQDKYDLSLFSDNFDNIKNFDSKEISKSTEKTLERIKNGLPFSFDKD